MKYLFAVLASLVLVAGLANLNAQDHSDHMGKGHNDDHKHGDHDGHMDGDHDDHMDGDKKEEVKEWGGKVKTDLKNKKDPVGDKKIEDADTFTAVWYGFKVHFADARGLKKFKRQPYRYSAKLGLSMDGLTDIKKVDPSKCKKAKSPELCPFCSEEIDEKGDVYILHRGFKIYFGCWMGCWKKFLTEPSKYYDDYGLVEKDGKLMLKSDAEKEKKKDEKKDDKKDK
jgi:YHS domain-containing protein